MPKLQKEQEYKQDLNPQQPDTKPACITSFMMSLSPWRHENREEGVLGRGISEG